MSPTQDTSFDDSLDERQRHMLQAMGIKLWLPDANDAAPAIAQAPGLAAAAAPAQQAVSSITSEKNQPFADVNTAKHAIKNIAPLTPPTQASPTPAAHAPRPDGIEQMDWPALQSAVSGCQACGLCASRKNAVFGVGPPPLDAAQAPQLDWLIVGEAPTEHEDAQGEPFVGQEGKLLDNMLAAMKIAPSEDGTSIGLSRARGVYITNVLKCRPPASRNASAEEVAMCEAYLARQIELLRPKIILAMGKYAISSLTGSTEPLGKLRGRVHALKHASYSAPVIVTYHPANLLRNLPDKAKAWADLQLAMQTYRELLTAID